MLREIVRITGKRGETGGTDQSTQRKIYLNLRLGKNTTFTEGWGDSRSRDDVVIQLRPAGGGRGFRVKGRQNPRTWRARGIYFGVNQDLPKKKSTKEEIRLLPSPHRTNFVLSREYDGHPAKEKGKGAVATRVALHPGES